MADASGHDPSEDAEALALRDALQRVHEQDPFARYGAHGVGIGQKVVAGEAIARLAVRFHVACKVPLSQLPPERRIPETVRVRRADGEDIEVPTDVVEAPPGSPLATDLTGVVRPVPGGVKGKSMSYYGSGTLGGWVWDRTDDTIVFLSNQHVLGNTVGGEVQQPGPSGGIEDPTERIGQVKRSMPIVPYSGRPEWRDCNFVDAAIGEADGSDLLDLTVVDIGPAVYVTAAPVESMQVEKTGQKTGHTVGVVTDFPYHTILPFPEGDAVMCDCFRVVPTDPEALWSTNGDSGSLVFAASAEPGLPAAVGLLFGGGGVAGNNWGVACTIANVFGILNLGPLCDGGFAAFLDALFGDEPAPAAARGQDVAPLAVIPRERLGVRAFHSGLARDVEARLATSADGRLLTEAVRRHRAELLALLVRDGDVRRATVAALRPLLRGAATTADVLDRRLTERDVARLVALSTEVSRKASEDLRVNVDRLRRLGADAADRSLGEVFGVHD